MTQPKSNRSTHPSLSGRGPRPREGRRSRTKAIRPADSNETAHVLTIDVGNSHSVLGVFRGETLLDHFRLTSSIPRTGDELRPLVASLVHPWRDELKASGRVILSSVVPSLTQAWRDLSARLLGVSPMLLTSDLDLGLLLDVPDPASVGADRIANAVGVASAYRLPAIVVDLGTTTNFDVVREGPRYVGGAIAPGILTSAEDLFRRGARLAKVEIRRPEFALGRTTQECLQSGIYFGAVGQIDGLVQRIAKELGIRPTVVATGGLAESITADSEMIDSFDPALTLRGLRVLEARNHGR